MLQPAPRMMSAPAKKSVAVPRTERGDAIGIARGAARSVEKRHGKKRYIVPAGLSRRMSSAYGTHDWGRWDRIPAVGGE